MAPLSHTREVVLHEPLLALPPESLPSEPLSMDSLPPTGVPAMRPEMEIEPGLTAATYEREMEDLKAVFMARFLHRLEDEGRRLDTLPELQAKCAVRWWVVVLETICATGRAPDFLNRFLTVATDRVNAFKKTSPLGLAAAALSKRTGAWDPSVRVMSVRDALEDELRGIEVAAGVVLEDVERHRRAGITPELVMAVSRCPSCHAQAAAGTGQEPCPLCAGEALMADLRRMLTPSADMVGGAAGAAATGGSAALKRKREDQALMRRSQGRTHTELMLSFVASFLPGMDKGPPEGWFGLWKSALAIAGSFYAAFRDAVHARIELMHCVSRVAVARITPSAPNPRPAFYCPSELAALQELQHHHEGAEAARRQLVLAEGQYAFARHLQRGQDAVVQGRTAQQCSVCLDDATGLISVLPCAHEYHRDCIKHHVAESNKRGVLHPLCPLCRAKFRPNAIINAVMVIKAAEEGESLDDDADADVGGGDNGAGPRVPEDIAAPLPLLPSRRNFAQRAAHEDGSDNGTKIRRLVELLGAFGPHTGRKALVFSQFDEALRILAAALSTAGIAHVVAKRGNAKQYNAALAAFRQDRHVLLLRVRDAGQGLSLTEASDIFIMEPVMGGDLGVEKQVLGRVDRIGQRFETVCHHLYLKDTVEERVRDRDAAPYETIREFISLLDM